MILTQDSYYTIMMTTLDRVHARLFYIEQFKKTEPCFKIQKEWGFAFDSFEECKRAILEKLKTQEGNYIDFIPKQGISNKKTREKTKEKR